MRRMKSKGSGRKSPKSVPAISEKLPTYEFRFTREQWSELPLGIHMTNSSLRHNLERLASRYLESRWSLAVAPADPRTRARLRTARRSAADFEKTLEKIDPKSLKLLGVRLFRHVANLSEYHRTLKNQVRLFRSAASEALGERRSDAEARSPEVDLASEVAHILKAFGIKPSLQENAPWAQIVKTVLNSAGKNSAAIVGILRKAKAK